ncbi:MAG: stage II sporulation protein M [Proteobacteria bacterium]|nr:stage II sporulation protein M [Pseudomonadota bacterium]
MLAIPALYRATLSSLSVAPASSLDQALVDYLEALSARAYFFVYGSRTTLAERLLDFFASAWPDTVRAMWRETLAAALVTLAGLAAAYFLVRADPSFFFSFVPESLAGGRDPTTTTEQLRATLYGAADGHAPLSVFAAFLFTHNAQISFFAFALGIAFCLPSILLIAYNGCSLGAMFALFDAHGLAAPFAGWVLVHGVTELLAIMLAGAAGIRIGWAVAFPGPLSRLQAAERAGREGGIAMLGVVIMLFIAGILEGFARQLVVQDGARYAIAAASAIAWFGYFYIPRRRRP